MMRCQMWRSAPLGMGILVALLAVKKQGDTVLQTSTMQFC